MTAWRDVEAAEPEFAQAVLAIMNAHRHKTMATIRADGSPRISGIELTFDSGELWMGSMPGSRKGADLRRDGRCALHSASVHPPEGEESSWSGDAKISGTAVLVNDPEERGRVLGDEQGDVFRVDIAEVVRTRVGEPADHLVIELWRPGQPLRRTRRE